MTQPHPDNLYFNVDLVAVDPPYMVVRDRRTGRDHTIGFDGIAIGANECGEGYTLVVPRVIASVQGMLS